MWTKDPNATIDFSFDFSQWLAGTKERPWQAGDDELAEATWTVPAGLNKVAEPHTNRIATLWVSGGTEGQSYTVTCRITTTGGRTDERDGTIKIKNRKQTA